MNRKLLVICVQLYAEKQYFVISRYSYHSVLKKYKFYRKSKMSSRSFLYYISKYPYEKAPDENLTEILLKSIFFISSLT